MNGGVETKKRAVVAKLLMTAAASRRVDGATEADVLGETTRSASRTDE
jgi:hypothetical protein